MRLVVLAPNWLGDVVMALPAIAAVRRHSPARDADRRRAGRRSHRSRRWSGRRRDRSRSSRAWSRRCSSPSPNARRLRARTRSTPRCCCRTRFTRRGSSRRAGIPERWGYRGGPARAAADARGAAAAQRHACTRPSTTSTSSQALGIRRRRRCAPEIRVDARTARTAVALLRAARVGRRPLVGFAPGAAYGRPSAGRRTASRRSPPGSSRDGRAGRRARRAPMTIATTVRDRHPLPRR